MYVVIVKIQVKPEFREPFLVAMVDNARSSEERGRASCSSPWFRTDDPNRIHLFEVYRDENAFRLT
jgi:quinol monooxygenase YgiN